MYRAIPFLFLLLFAPAARGQERPRPLSVSLFSGATEYHSDETLASLKDYLESNYDVRCTLNRMTRIDDLPGIDQLDTCDVAVIFVRRMQLPPAQVAKVKKYMNAGKPVVGIRTASHAFQTWLAFDHEVLGGDYQNHAPQDKRAYVTPVPKNKDHDVLKGVEPFDTTGKLYANPHPARDIKVLLTATTDDNAQPVAWVRTRHDHHDQRIFYTSLGTPEDFKEKNFLRLIANAVFWTCGRPVQPKG